MPPFLLPIWGSVVGGSNPLTPTLKQIQQNSSQLRTFQTQSHANLLAKILKSRTELTDVKAGDIEWDTHAITIIGKDNKQWRAQFIERTATVIRTYLADSQNRGDIWGISRCGVRLFR